MVPNSEKTSVTRIFYFLKYFGYNLNNRYAKFKKILKKNWIYEIFKIFYI